MCLIAPLFIFCSCSSVENDETEIETVLIKFYKSLNKKDFKQAESLCSKNMQEYMTVLKKNMKDIVEYKKVSLRSINIDAYSAVATVECTDVFSNTVEMQWNFIKQSNKWKLNNCNTTKAQRTEYTDQTRNDEPKKDGQKESSTQKMTEYVDSEKDSVHN